MFLSQYIGYLLQLFVLAFRTEELMYTSANHLMVIGLDHESSDASEGPGAVCLLFPCKQGWRDHHSGIFRNRTHERVYSCLKLFLLLVLSLPSLKNHQESRA